MESAYLSWWPIWSFGFSVFGGAMERNYLIKRLIQKELQEERK